MADPIKKLGLSCPKGGDFYICQDAKVRFLGCCAKDPCADGSGVCKQDDLRYSSFDKAHYSEIPAQQCSAATGANTWWTCSGASPPFMGCCSANPCDSVGCPKDKLLPARLADSSSAASVFVVPTSATKTAKPTTTPPGTTAPGTTPGTTTGTTTATRTRTATATDTTGTTTGTGAAFDATSPPTQAPDNGGGGRSGGLQPGVIAGIAIGAFLVVALLAFLAFWCGWKRRSRRDVISEDETQAMNLSQVQAADRWSPYKDSFGSPHQSAAYSSAYSPDPTQQNFAAADLQQHYLAAADPRRASGAPSTVRSSWLSPDSRHFSNTSRESQPWGAALDHHPPTHLAPVAELGNTMVERAPVELPGSQGRDYDAPPTYRPLGRSAAHEFGGHPERI